jgi:hypothetical protein
MTPNEPITAEDRLANAFALWAGASKIALGEEEHRLIPFYLLIGFSIELALKAYLSHVGRPAHELKSRAVRHNLAALLAASIRHGFTLDELVTTLVESLSEDHQDFTFRYPSTPAFATAVTGQLLEDVALAIELKGLSAPDVPAELAD